jgi:hypothetical protein
MPRRIPRNIETALALAFFLIAILLSIAEANGRRKYANFSLHDGDFQNFNIIRRMLNLQAPGADFNSYLGLGPSYLMTAATGVAGGSFGGSLVAISLLCHASFLLVVVLLCYLAGADLVVTSCVVMLSVMLELGFVPEFVLASPIYALLVKPWAGLFYTGNSVRMLRSLLPFAVTAAGLFVAARGRSRRRSNAYSTRSANHSSAVVEQAFSPAFGPRYDFCQGLLRPLLTSRLAADCAVGLVAGMCVPWSNDFGPPTSASITVLFLLFVRRARWRELVIRIARMAACGLLSAGLTVTLLTRGAPAEWLRYNYGVARDQFWYFNLGRTFGVCSVAQIPMVPLLLAGACLLGLWAWKRPNRSAQHIALTFLLLTSLLSGYLPYLGGINESSYFRPFNMVCIACILSLLFQISQNAVRYWLKMVLIAGTLTLALLTAVRPAADMFRRNWFAPVDPAAWMTVPALGANVPRHFDKAVALGAEIGALCRGDRVPANRRMLSAYTSLMDDLAGSYSDARSDYLIHALGDPARADVLGALASPPRFATTLRADHTPWEIWHRCVNWYFYRELLRCWRAVDRTSYATLWIRQPLERPWRKEAHATCEVVPKQPGVIQLRFTLNSGESELHYLDTLVRYSFRPVSGGWRSGVLRHRLIVEDMDTALHTLWPGVVLHGSLWTGEFGMPIDRGEWRFPVMMKPGSGTVQLTALPVGSAEVQVTQCSVEPAALASEIDTFPLTSLIPASATDGDWGNGIWRRDVRAGFLVTDQTDLVGLAPGRWLRFASGERRRIQSIIGGPVWLEGRPLDPARDGYPHRIVIEPAPGASGAGEPATRGREPGPASRGESAGGRLPSPA